MMHAPIKVITVEREYGSRGGEFAHDLATRLGWKLLDSELVTGAARMAGVDPKLAAKFDERLDLGTTATVKSSGTIPAIQWRPLVMSTSSTRSVC